MPYFQKIGIYANNGTSHVRSAITKLEASLDDFGCRVFFEKTSSTKMYQVLQSECVEVTDQLSTHRSRHQRSGKAPYK